MQKKIRTIIIEDIQLAIETLSNLLKLHPEIDIVAVASNKDQAINLIQKHKPDLLFLDIKIGKDSGFDVLDSCINYFKYVIFTTAYSEFVMESYKYMTVHFLLKPIHPNDLRLAINKVSNLTNRTQSEKNSVNEIAKLFYNEKGYWKSVEIEDIIYLESMRSYCKVHTNYGVIQLSKNLSKVLENLPPNHQIIRIHKSYAVNIKYISQMKRGMSSSLILMTGLELPVSILHKTNIVKLLGIRS